MQNGCIAGPSLCGKTTLAKKLSAEYWRQRGMVSLVQDTYEDKWGEHAWVVSDRKFFWDTVWSRQGSLVIVDDGSLNIDRDRDLTPIFTMLRHNRHKLLVIVHSSSNLLPSMRQQLDTLFLFRQTIGACKDWYEVTADAGVHEAADLGRYEFIEWHSFSGCIRHPPKSKISPAPVPVLPDSQKDA